MEKVYNVDLAAPLNLSFVDNRDPSGRFISNSGVFSESGLHNAFMERGDGQWLGEFNEGEIRAHIPVTRVLEFDHGMDARGGRLAWLTPELRAVWPDDPDLPVRLSDGRTATIPAVLRKLDRKASSGIGNQYMVAVGWGGAQLHVHIFGISDAGDPVFSQVNINLDTSTNTGTAPVSHFRMGTGELGEQTLQRFLDSAGTIGCFPMVYGLPQPDADAEIIEAQFYGPSETDFPGLPSAGGRIDGGTIGREGHWMAVHVGDPVFRPDRAEIIPNPGHDPREEIGNPDFDSRETIPNPDFDPREYIDDPEDGTIPNPDYDSREYVDNPGYDPRERIPNPGHDPREEIGNPDFDPDRLYERTVRLRYLDMATVSLDRYLHVGIDVGSFSLNGCAVIRINANGSFTLERVVKGFFMPDLAGNVWGFPFPESHVTGPRGYCPFLRDGAGAFVSMSQENIRANAHRGTVFRDNMLQHLPDTARNSADLNGSQSRTRLVAAWHPDRLVYLPVRTSQNFNGVYTNTSYSNRNGITALFHGFAVARQPLELFADSSDLNIPDFGGFYCVPTGTVPNARLSAYGIAQYSMAGAFEAAHRSRSSQIVGHHHGQSGDPWSDVSVQQNSTLTFQWTRGTSIRGNPASYHSVTWHSSNPAVVRFIRLVGRAGDFIAVGMGTAIVTHTRQEDRAGPLGYTERTSTVRITVTAPPPDRTHDTGLERLRQDCGQMVINYPAKDGVPVSQSSYGVAAWNRPQGGGTHGTFSLLEEIDEQTVFANVLYGGDTQIPDVASTSLSRETMKSPQALGIFDARVAVAGGIEIFVTVADGQALWTSVNDTKVSTGAPTQILRHTDSVLLIFDKYTVYVHDTNRDGTMVPEIRLITHTLALVSQTGVNCMEKTDGVPPLRTFHAFSGLGYRTNIIGPRHLSGTDEVQSAFQDILWNNRHTNVADPNHLTLPRAFSTLTPPYEHAIRHININTPPGHITENIHAYRFSLPVSVRRGPNLDEWVTVRGNNVQMFVIDGVKTLTSDILAARSSLRQIVLLGQMFEFDRTFISPVDIDMGVRVYGTPVNKFNKVYAGSSSQRAYFFDVVSKTLDAFNLDGGFDVGVPLDLIDGVLNATPVNEFSYTNVRRLTGTGGGKGGLASHVGKRRVRQGLRRPGGRRQRHVGRGRGALAARHERLARAPQRRPLRAPRNDKFGGRQVWLDADLVPDGVQGRGRRFHNPALLGGGLLPFGHGKKTVRGKGGRENKGKDGNLLDPRQEKVVAAAKGVRDEGKGFQGRILHHAVRMPGGGMRVAVADAGDRRLRPRLGGGVQVRHGVGRDGQVKISFNFRRRCKLRA